jgi:hypothetical protein
MAGMMMPGCAVDPRFPRIAGLDETTALQLEGVLTHVPDVAVLVLGVRIEGPFHRDVLGDRVPNDRRRDAEDHLRLVRHDLDVGLRRGSADAVIRVGRSRLERPVGIVDRLDEVRRIDRR